MNASADRDRDSRQKTYWEEQTKRRRPFHPAAAAFARPKAELLADMLQDIAGQPSAKLSLLEVGCGNGFFSVWLNQLFKSITLLDFSRIMLRQNPVGPRVVGGAEQLPFRDGAFDVVFCSNLLHHLAAPVTAVREMARVSRSFVALSEPNRDHPLMLLLSLANPAERGVLKFSKSYLESLAVQAGLQICRSIGQGVILPNKTPAAAVPLLEWVESRAPVKMFNIVVGRKTIGA